MKSRRWLLGGLLFAGGVGLTALAARRAKLVTDTTRLLLIGDSMAQGLDPQLHKLADEQGIAAYRGHGIVGSRIDQWARDPWLDDAIATFQPTLILVSLGTNDEAMGAGAADRQAPHLAALLDKLSASGADLAWIGPPALPFPRHGVTDLVHANVPHFFDSEKLDIPRAGDGLHPNVGGYAGWAGSLWQWLT
jgi:lysophospholipase L1-like esterase